MEYLNESFDSFVNEAKKKKKKGISKSDINKILKNAGFENVSMTVNSFKNKTYKPLTKGLPGHTIGPMTSTNAHNEQNRKHVENLKSELRSAGGQIDFGRDAEQYDLVVKFPAGKKDFVLKFMWMQFPLYAHNDSDPGYQRFWLTYVMDEIKPVEEN
jgi:hypothetical protein